MQAIGEGCRKMRLMRCDRNSSTYSLLDLLQKKYVLSLKACSSLGQTLNYWVDWHLLKLAQPARS